MDARIRAAADLMVAEVREYAGLHAYDGVVQDLSPAGVTAALGRLGPAGGDGQTGRSPHDEAHLAAVEASLRAVFGELELHRRNPLLHLDELDLACYDRDYAPAADRAAARARHLAAWPDAADAAVAALDQVSAPVAATLLPAVEGLADGIPTGPTVDDATVTAARAAHRRLVAHIRTCAATGDPDPALGDDALSRLLGAGEAMDSDLGHLEAVADAERDRLRAHLADACAQLAPGQPVGEVMAALATDHPDAGGVLDEARAQVAETIAFTRDHDLVPGLDGDCEVRHAPPSRRHAMAMISWAAPYEPDAPSVYYVTPPEPTWPVEEQTAWLEVFNRTQLPAITVHEVAPDHFAHGRALRHVQGEVRRIFQSAAFVEGWAHYAEELCVEEGFRGGDPRFAIGVWTEALVRVTRMAAALGVHRGTMTLEDAVARFEQDAFLRGVAARAEAMRATYDPTYGRYTQGKLEILRLRREAHRAWGTGYTHARFHSALLALGAPPLGLARAALDEGNRTAS